MVKKLFGVVIAVAFTIGIASSALADIVSDTGPGCGLGKLLWNQPNFTGQQHILQQVLASTTNGIFGTQTFGISTGTSGCTNDGVLASNQKVNVFAEANLDHLRQDMAQGHGEYLASLAALLSIPQAQQNDFFSLTQEKYHLLFTSEHTTSQEMLTALNREISRDPKLAQFVR